MRLLQLPPLSGLEDRIHALLLSAVDEGASVNNDHVGILSGIGDLHPIFHEVSDHDFRIDQILGTAKRDEADCDGGCAD